MSTIATLQKAIYSNLETLRSLYQQAEGLRGVIDRVSDKAAKKQLTNDYNEVIKTLEKHVDTTDELIQALKSALEE